MLFLLLATVGVLVLVLLATEVLVQVPMLLATGVLAMGLLLLLAMLVLFAWRVHRNLMVVHCSYRPHPNASR